MRRRNRNRDGVSIDLTSLLDVIFILLMVVLCSQFDIENDEQNLRKVQEEAVQEANNQKNLYESGLKSAEYAIPVSIVIPFDPDDPTQREIRLLVDDNEPSVKGLQGNDTANSWNELETELTSLANQFNNQPVIVSVGNDKDLILYRDEQRLNEILDRVADEHGNIFITNGQG